MHGEDIDTYKVALVGKPNVGKSVIFGLLTGKYVTVSNYPGTTVEVSRGVCNGLNGGVEVVDTPGANSLIPLSEDECEAGRIDGVMSAAYLLHSARISEVVQGAQLVVDLGCGPATHLGQVAELNPDIQFHGIDLSEVMLANARSHAESLGLKNVRFTRGDITRPDFIPDRSADAVISTMTLHHLPTIDHLRRCFQEIRRILRPGGGLYLVDFGRLKSLKSGRVQEFTFKAGDEAEDVPVETHEMQYLYEEGDKYIFMDNFSYEQYGVPKGLMAFAS